MLFCTAFTRISVRFCGVRTPPFYVLLNITNSEKETFSENMKSTNNNVQNTSQLALHQQTENLLSSRRNICFTVNACLEKIGGMFSFEHMSF